MLECEETSFSYFVDSDIGQSAASHSSQLSILAHCCSPLTVTLSLAVFLNSKNDSQEAAEK